jgi:hypothetical protein
MRRGNGFRKIPALILISLVGFFSSVKALCESLSFFDDDLVIRAPITIEGETNFFVVDTGALATALDVQHRSKLGPITKRIAGQDFYKAPKMLVGATPVDLSEIFVTDLTMFRQITGERCDGILGMDFLSTVVVELDFDQQLIGFRQPSIFPNSET